MSATVINAKQKVVGMTTEQAFTFLENEGIQHRVCMKNGVARVLTCDYKPERINLITENDIVVDTKLG